MDPLYSISNIILSIIKLVIISAKSVEDIMVQTDNENLEKLLKKDWYANWRYQ